MNKYIDETVFPVILNNHCTERKTAKDFKLISKDASELRLAYEQVKHMLAPSFEAS